MNSLFLEQPALAELYHRVAKIPPIDAGHGFDHTVRVALLSVQLIELESQRQEKALEPRTRHCALAAGLLHDCVPVAKNSPDRHKSAEWCAALARKWLYELGFYGESEICSVVWAIEDHSYSSGRVPRDLVGEVLQDADRLEALGALGLYRTIATGVAFGAQLFDPEDPWAERRALDDKRFTIDHFYTKLLKLPATFRTESARAEAASRADFLKSFLDQLKSELESRFNY
jgi:uncharacterized protein